MVHRAWLTLSVRCARVTVLIAALLLGGLPALARGQAKPPATEPQPLFDGKTLAGWTSTRFIGEGPVRVDSGRIILERGNDLTGVTWTGAELPRTNYELSLEAMRLKGGDFFAGITFPVDDSHCSLILGGWGGTVVGLSSINGLDASENQTSQSIPFESDRWYAVRIRVTPAAIEAWLDGQSIIEQELKGRKIEVRLEVEPSRPLGIASFRTMSAIRNIQLRRFEP